MLSASRRARTMDEAKVKRDVMALLGIANAIVDSVAEAGDLGCAESTIYLALQQHGGTIETHNGLIDILIRAGRLRRENHRLYALPLPSTGCTDTTNNDGSPTETTTMTTAKTSMTPEMVNALKGADLIAAYTSVVGNAPKPNTPVPTMRKKIIARLEEQRLAALDNYPQDLEDA